MSVLVWFCPHKIEISNCLTYYKQKHVNGVPILDKFSKCNFLQPSLHLNRMSGKRWMHAADTLTFKNVPKFLLKFESNACFVLVFCMSCVDSNQSCSFGSPIQWYIKYPGETFLNI
jgi:hypothetical protein